MQKVLAWVGMLTATVVACVVAFALCDFTASTAEAEVAVGDTAAEEREAFRREMDAGFDQEAALARIRAEEQIAVPQPSEELELERRMAEGITKINPWYRTKQRLAKRLAIIILDAATEHDQQPWIALSIAAKESTFAPSVGQLRVTGSMDEEGYFQVMPRGYARHVCGKGRSMGNARANADTAMCYLARVRAECETDDPWEYVLAYGMNIHRQGCPSGKSGRKLRPSRRARAALCKMVGDDECGEIWPE